MRRGCVRTMEEPSPAKRRRVEDEEGNKERREVLVASLRKLADAINKAAEETGSEFQADDSPVDFEKFLNTPGGKGIRRLWSHVASYEECLRSNGVGTYAELEKLWESQYGSQDVRDAVEEVLDAEERHEALLKDVQKEFVKAHSELQLKEIGDALPGDLKVADGRTKEVQEIQSYWEGSKFTLFVLLRHFG